MTDEHAAIARCLDLEERHIATAIGGRATTKALLEHLASVSAPDSGVAKVLLVYARLATTACDWAEGDLGVDLVARGGATTIEALTELGAGLRERLFAPLTFAAPLAEFARAIRRVPHLVAPLIVRSSSEGRLTLSATAIVRRTTAPPPPIAIAGESLFEGTPEQRPPTAPPPPAVPKDPSLPMTPSGPLDDLDAGWDE